MLGPILAIGQQYGNEKQQIKQDLLEKSKRQKKTGFILLGAGAVSTVAGALIFANNFTLIGSEDDGAGAAGATLFVAGGLSMLSSIPVFIASSKNRERATEMSARIKLESLPQVFPKYVTSRYPAISLQWRIK